ncbi:DNA repair protein REV1 [Apostasia shenzhenica]|uniref:DNA polymerase eta n=1 Tax=Apostasia shenzhenica TaxID=1088818 RepID=A0A2H9ZTR1_9ASPA|nr:DNA repair protein REV1 [Apostasia shenzhenica]
MPIPRPDPQGARVIAHVDLDCFYVQVEQRKQPELRGLPTAVVQYNSWKGGGLIAVSYEARKFGVKRSMRGDEAKMVCPEIQLVQVPIARDKADLNTYRNAGSEVVSILSRKGRCERASIDEVYLDLTDAAELMLSETPLEILEDFDEDVLKSHVLGIAVDEDKEKNVRGWLCRSGADHRDKLLACGAIIVAKLRSEVLKETEFTCSAGIAHNKMLAKLASGMHKPAQQTIVPSSAVKELLAYLPVKKMKQLGGKLGSSLLNDLGVHTVGDLLQFSEEKLQELYGINTGTWLWNISRGINGDEVEGRILPKSHGCGKTFPGPKALKTTSSVDHWLNQLCEELSERIQSDLDQHKRVAQTLTLHARAFKVNDMESRKKFPSKSCPLRYGISKIQEDAKKLFDSGLREFLGSESNVWKVTSLSLTASKLLDTPLGTSSILRFFQGKISSSAASDGTQKGIQDDHPSASLGCKGDIVSVYNDGQKLSVAEEYGKGNDINFQDTRVNRLHSPNRKSKEKGKDSITRYFSCGNSSSRKQAFDGLNVTNQQGGGCEVDERGSADDRTHRQTDDSWTLNAENVDPSVIDELPMEIQQEVRGWLRSSKRINSAKGGSSIFHYFSSINN